MNMRQLGLRAGELDGALRALKDDLHRYPELAMQEVRTTGVLRAALEELGLELVDLEMDVGVVAVLRGGKPGGTVALRADMDALRYQEPAGGRVVSCRPGLMHACGHDFHMACLWGAARLLADMRQELEGTVIFLLQPAEEGTRGAREMLTRGLWDKVGGTPDYIFALHNWPTLDCGRVAVLDGAIMAGKDTFHITLRGVSGHPGEPHQCTDVIVAGAALVSAIQTVVSRNADPLESLICGVCSIHAGNESLVIDDTLTLAGTIRSHSDSLLSYAGQRVRELALGIATAYGCTAEVEIRRGVPATVNHPGAAAVARRAAAAVFGPEGLVDAPRSMVCEDFALFAGEVPGCFLWVGSGYPGRENGRLHSLQFETDDRGLVSGAHLLARLALEGLSPGQA